MAGKRGRGSNSPLYFYRSLWYTIPNSNTKETPMAWYDEAVFYHIYPLGMTGAPKQNDYGESVERLNLLLPWLVQMLVKYAVSSCVARYNSGFTNLYPFLHSRCHTGHACTSSVSSTSLFASQWHTQWHRLRMTSMSPSS